MRRCKYHFCPDCVIREDLFPAKDVVGCDVERDTIEITTRAAQDLFKLVDKAQARAFHAKLKLEEVKAELEAARRWARAWKQAAKRFRPRGYGKRSLFFCY